MAPTKLAVHVHNDPHSGAVFGVTPERVAAASRRFSRLARRIAITYSDDAAGFDEAMRTAEVLIAGHFTPRELGAKAPRLKWIQSTNAGVEDVAPHLPPGVTLTNASGVHGPKGSEFCLTALLMLNHALPHFATRQRERRWEQRFTSTIAGKTVVLVGVGAIGRAVARLVRRFGVRVLGVRRGGQPDRLVEEMYRPQDFAKVLPRADFLVICTPLTEETRGLIGRRELDLLPPHAGVVNLGRGAVLDNDALADKLERGELAGAVLDVLPQEPLPPDSRLWATPNLIITPHCAVDDGEQYVARCLDVFFENLDRYLGGRRLRNVIDPKLGY